MNLFMTCEDSHQGRGHTAATFHKTGLIDLFYDLYFIFVWPCSLHNELIVDF